MKKILSTTREKSLLELRKTGLDEIRSRESMQPHGKYKGMDAFSWESPNFEVMTSVISSFPFKVIWLGTHEQMRCALKYYPEVMNNIESTVIYDTAFVKFETPAILGIQNIIGVGNLENALRVADALNEPKRILFFTTEGEASLSHIQQFDSFIKG